MSRFPDRAQVAAYGRFEGAPSGEELEGSSSWMIRVGSWLPSAGGDGNRLGFALQLTTVRFWARSWMIP